MKRVYNKLVRDKIPEVIKQDGKTAVIHIADDREYWIKLTEKLQEEVDEFLFAKSEEELADVLEVIDAICAVRGIDKKRVHTIQEKKRAERGGFTKKIILEETE
jgi:predicted house-cleaning noncanonical NTP pyrophosphatase (MazG superfamily)